jgi:hypothetical protein
LDGEQHSHHHQAAAGDQNQLPPVDGIDDRAAEKPEGEGWDQAGQTDRADGE